MVYCGLLLLAGILQGVMLSVNAQLGNYFSLFAVSFFVHGVGMVLLLAYFAAKRERLHFRGAPWYVYCVGLLGIALVVTSSWCTMKIGAAACTALSIAGQLIASAVVDRFGMFGMPVTRVTAKELPGYLLVLAGVVLVAFV